MSSIQSQSTICALATPAGVGGMAIIRVCGSNALPIVDMCFSGKHKLEHSASHTIHFGKFVHNDTVLDTVTASVFIAPHSYTGENTVEIGCHGGMVVQQQIVEALLDCGARHAEPGEFTKLAFLNGKLDLTQVESVADIIHATSTLGSQASVRQLTGGFTQKLQELRAQLLDICALLEIELDFAHEDIEFVDRTVVTNKIHDAISYCSHLLESHKGSEILRSGLYVGLIGYPNSGKSSLFNALLQRKRAIVSNVAGTTRDYIEEHLTISNIAVRLFDTAGIRDTDDVIELEGIEFSKSIIEQCHVLLIINDVTRGKNHSQPLVEYITTNYPHIIVTLLQNKADLLNTLPHPTDTIYTSATTGMGIESVRDFIKQTAQSQVDVTSSVLINARHVGLLQHIVESLHGALTALELQHSNEFVALDIRQSIELIGNITGNTSNEDVINEIFSRFCIGK
ncbi:MAG: tRNA uridine-5-carboxymethylaminomethyl(34) synthesis GTPase MnmE [Candidatus Kapaibacterium sp.]